LLQRKYGAVTTSYGYFPHYADSEMYFRILDSIIIYQSTGPGQSSKSIHIYLSEVQYAALHKRLKYDNVYTTVEVLVQVTYNTNLRWWRVIMRGRQGVCLRYILSAFLAIYFLSALPGAVTPGQAQDTNPNIDPQALERLQNMSYFLGSKSEYTFKADAMFDVLIRGERTIQYSAQETVYIQKPDKFTIKFVTDIGGYKIWYTAGQATLLSLPTNDFSLAPLPGSIDQALKKLLEQYNFAPALSEFLFINTYRVMTENVTSGAYFGTSKVFGTKCDHLAFVQDDINWQIWIESGRRPIPRKLVITYKNQPGSPQFIAILKDWVTDKPITGYAFKADIPNVNNRVDMNQLMDNPKLNMGSIRSK